MIGSMYVFTSVFFDQRWEKLLERDLSHTYRKLYVRVWTLEMRKVTWSLTFAFHYWIMFHIANQNGKQNGRRDDCNHHHRKFATSIYIIRWKLLDKTPFRSTILIFSSIIYMRLSWLGPSMIQIMWFKNFRGGNAWPWGLPTRRDEMSKSGAGTLLFDCQKNRQMIIIG